MNNYWFLVTVWHDDHGHLQRQVEHWADSTRLSSEQLFASSDAAKAKLLSHVYTLDLPSGSASDRLRHLVDADQNRVITAILWDIVPIPTGGDRWVHHEVAHARERPADASMTLLLGEYGISLYRLATPFEVREDAAAAPNI